MPAKLLLLSHYGSLVFAACFAYMDLPAFRLGYGLACFQAQVMDYYAACYKQAHFFPFLFLLPPGNVFFKCHANADGDPL